MASVGSAPGRGSLTARVIKSGEPRYHAMGRPNAATANTPTSTIVFWFRIVRLSVDCMTLVSR